jgi:hypothetical protein
MRQVAVELAAGFLVAKPAGISDQPPPNDQLARLRITPSRLSVMPSWR